MLKVELNPNKGEGEVDDTYFFGTVETYGIRTLSTNEPNPSRKLDVIFCISSASWAPREESFSLSSSMDLDKSMR